MQYQSLMLKYNHKKIQYGRLFKSINHMVIKYVALYEPEWLQYNPMVTATFPAADQYVELDPADPATYRTTVEWPSPLPMDVLLKLNEIQAKMSMGLESKKGAMKDMGEWFPDQKLNEIYEELMDDTKSQAALNLISAQTNQFIIQATGMTADGQPIILPGMDQVDAEGKPTGMAPMVDPNLAMEIMARAYQQAPPAREDFDEE
jgi:hypothetical protein